MADDKPLKAVHLSIAYDAATSGAEKYAPLEPADKVTLDNIATDLRPIEFSHDALGNHISASFGGDWKAIDGAGPWMRWDGQRFVEDRLQAAYNCGRQCLRIVAVNCDNIKIARQISSRTDLHAALKNAAAMPRHAVGRHEFDANDWLLNTAGGVVDLRTGRIQPHDRDLLMTRMTPAAPEGDCPTFYSFLREATGGDADTVAYLHRALGYALTGSVEEHALFFLYGPGGTGKSVLLNALREALGDYAVHAPMDVFTVATGERHSTDLAMLEGARLVTASETEEGRRWDEAKLKSITGGDPITARRMRQDNVTFLPKFKLVIAGNYRPTMRSADDAMKRRMNIIPMMIKPPVVDHNLSEKLRAERGGILKWMIEGCLEWQQRRLGAPAVVLQATSEYFDQENVIGRWIADRCVREKATTTNTQVLYRDFKNWASGAGEFVVAENRFSQRLAAMGFTKKLHPATRRAGFAGLALVAGDQTELAMGDGSGVSAPAAPDWRTDPAEDFER
ncbi:MAG TPA: phage/plasmid primase, P4 family [Magnetospirillaceae bacterium]|jgi:putative DNA primase/helicase